MQTRSDRQRGKTAVDCICKMMQELVKGETARCTKFLVLMAHIVAFYGIVQIGEARRIGHVGTVVVELGLSAACVRKGGVAAYLQFAGVQFEEEDLPGFCCQPDQLCCCQLSVELS